ncbi:MULTISPECIES: hypothetical protein [Pseudomonas]|uniref:hypothetical protein n=1 Tax=Pseudomonas TaxID=286 RepID=UPI003A89B48D
MTIRPELQPTPDNIRRTRLSLRMSETAAGALVYVSRESWRLYEKGETNIKMGLWELFLIKTGQLWIQPTTATPARASKHRGRVENLRPFAATSKGKQ